MATYRQKTKWWADYLCDTSELSEFNLNGRFPVRLQAQLGPAVLALESAIVSNGYRTPMGATGSYLCRKIANTDLWSLHAYGIAVDWDYPSNPHLRTPIPRGFGHDPRFELTEAQIAAVEGIVNDQGDQIWKWLGWSIGDTMHFEIDVPPGATTPKEPEDMSWINDIADATWTVWYDEGHIEGNPDVMPDYYFADGAATDAERVNAFNVAMRSIAKEPDTVTVFKA